MSAMMVGHNRPHMPFTHSQMTFPLRSSSPEEKPDEAILALSSTTSNHSTPFLLPHGEQSSSEKALGYGAFGVVWSVVDPRDGQKVALKRIPRVFHNTITAKRAYRELRMLCHLKHDNIISLIDIVRTDNYSGFAEMYLLCEFMQTDLHKIIVSSQPLSIDHVKIFVYQMLRGVKYLHTAKIIHRDIKPGNMLVNSNCLLKICDFGLARVEDPTEELQLTQEVVTQYYRPPELLMESSRYSYDVDMWSVGCTFAELLSRRILFQAAGPLEQLELIMNLTGTPAIHDLQDTHPDARCFVLTRTPRHPNLAFLYTLGPNISDQAVHLLSLMLKFKPEQRISAAEALNHPYLEEARLRYHSCMCACCCTVPASSTTDSGSGRRRFAKELDPSCTSPLPRNIDSGFRRLSEAKRLLWDTITEYYSRDERPYRVTLNKNARNYSALINSSVAHAKEAPNSHRW